MLGSMLRRFGDSGQLKIYVMANSMELLTQAIPSPTRSPYGSAAVLLVRTPTGAVQIQSSMNRYLCGDERGLRAYWSFDEGQGEKLRDTIGHSNGIISGPEWVPGVELARSEGCQDKFHRR